MNRYNLIFDTNIYNLYNYGTFANKQHALRRCVINKINCFVFWNTAWIFPPVILGLKRKNICRWIHWPLAVFLLLMFAILRMPDSLNNDATQNRSKRTTKSLLLIMGSNGIELYYWSLGQGQLFRCWSLEHQRPTEITIPLLTLSLLGLMATVGGTKIYLLLIRTFVWRQILVILGSRR